MSLMITCLRFIPASRLLDSSEGDSTRTSRFHLNASVQPSEYSTSQCAHYIHPHVTVRAMVAADDSP